MICELNTQPFDKVTRDKLHEAGLARATIAAQQVIRCLNCLGRRGEWAYGARISHCSGLLTGTVSPILGRLEASGLTHPSMLEDIDPEIVGRPRRRFHTLMDRVTEILPSTGIPQDCLDVATIVQPELPFEQD